MLALIGRRTYGRSWGFKKRTGSLGDKGVRAEGDRRELYPIIANHQTCITSRPHSATLERNIP
jgi:hypothetical protein